MAKKIKELKIEVTRTYTVPKGDLCLGCQALDHENDFCDAVIDELDYDVKMVKVRAVNSNMMTESHVNHKKSDKCIIACHRGTVHIGE